jgi:hypothetical protein
MNLSIPIEVVSFQRLAAKASSLETAQRQSISRRDAIGDSFQRLCIGSRRIIGDQAQNLAISKGGSIVTFIGPDLDQNNKDRKM